MSKHTLFDKIWDLHKVATLPTGQDQLLIGLHLVHEVTSPQAFERLRELGKRVAYPQRAIATIDHIIPTQSQARPFQDIQAEEMARALEKNVKEFGIRYFGPNSRRQGIVHIIGPELGFTRPGMTIACGDSHTSTHGAFGALAFGIGTTEVGLVLETQTLPLTRMKVRRITVSGKRPSGVFAKDVILKIIQVLGVKGGLGHAYEYGGDVFDAMTMEERMTVCNMSIEGGARIGYVNPDDTTFNYMKDREFAPKGDALEKEKAFWKAIASEPNADYDDVVTLNAAEFMPMLTWGINPGQSIGIAEKLPNPAGMSAGDKAVAEEAYHHMQLKAGEKMEGVKIDVAFIGSCTNARISDLRDAAKVITGKKVSTHVKLVVVPGSQQVKEQAEKEGLHDIFKAAGAQWREAGCSMCLAMNPDRLTGDELCASSSNRNFIGRQGSATGRTLLMSPAMVAASAVKGCVTDPREML